MAELSINPPEMVLKKNEPAPYSGILMSESNYRQHLTDLDDKMSCIDKMKECPINLMPPGFFEMSAVRPFILGAFVVSIIWIVTSGINHK